MTLSSGVLVLLASFASALALTVLVRRYAQRRAILDVPNDRSLHVKPTPRGGGLAIAATFVLGIIALAGMSLVPLNLAVALTGGGLLVALIGWVDDRDNLRPVVRIAAHTAAAAWALLWLGGIGRFELGGYVLESGAVIHVVTVIGIVWWTNLYNFMDGIDGIAGGQAVTVGLGAAGLIALTSASVSGLLPLVVAGAAAGFLVLNWAPARIFMGDTGSGFLGFTFAVLAIASEGAASLPLVYWVLLSGIFVFDSTVTLVRRVVRGQVWYAPHRSHAYQRLVAMGYSHARVAGGVVGFNVLMWGVLALAVSGWLHLGVAAAIELVALTVAYLLVESASPMFPDRVPATHAEERHV
jgi:Fuc2NAc and GlcNAc transferase